MNFTLFIPYQSLEVDESDKINDYYLNEGDYINALREEEASMGGLIFNAMSSNSVELSSYNAGFSKSRIPTRTVRDNIVYSKTECVLLSPDGSVPETVDSMIDKFASQDEFLVTVNIKELTMDPEFEEELREWTTETYNIVEHGKKMGREWIDTNILKKDLRLSFLNKSNQRVNFVLRSCEIEERISKYRYLLYVNKMNLLK